MGPNDSKTGRFTGSSGLQIAYLSGLESSNSDDTHFSQKELSALTMPALSTNDYQGVDILMTSQWPKGVEKYGLPVVSNLYEIVFSVDGFDTSSGSEAISQLAMILRPRYHFCGLQGVYYERQPYRNHKVLAEKERHVTRFIALAKYLYAFNIVPLSSMDKEELTKQPQGCTECPYKIDLSVIKDKEKTYLALAKGGLVDDHVLILPIGHYQSTSSLKKYHKSQGKAVVFFERNYKTQHLQIQIVPPGAPYFYAELPTGDKLLHRISKHFPLQFGRDILCSPPLLNMPERVDWKVCKLTKEDETDSAKLFKLKFKEYDFNFT
ncbi:hypothetical protein KUTeg_023860 [Tegillarca granosa]|uniref:CWF19-like protein 1 n=1 Tax=Tegillarca granosa TaxID=220873 RepID=A0ABQ9E8H0_TEGGR|nr:hypothetical protein KUTeg_023860 [Tegillarca granosa]